MTQPHYLIREQDLHAYIDGELSKPRRRAVERFLADRHLTLERAIELFRTNLGLHRYREKFYEDQELKTEVERLLKKHRCAGNEPPHFENVMMHNRG
ncbi:hypothetical protein FF098_008700 [Parvularcula flava]|uniref:Uncharacterized protein n=1 Tax=Aquisalinus luteolus TaxID=1566827 RepID=A0A8J3A1Z5_9PROT|nr:hypothetical protein [Aquisalinus luteolus]NHK27980.1 hypothetical protein [Aquisalinus luteolus]GGH97109.1 hypothetical protein GCM10011355_17530 [Aquisalinus luteolus]